MHARQSARVRLPPPAAARQLPSACRQPLRAARLPQAARAPFFSWPGSLSTSSSSPLKAQSSQTLPRSENATELASCAAASASLIASPLRPTFDQTVPTRRLLVVRWCSTTSFLSSSNTAARRRPTGVAPSRRHRRRPFSRPPPTLRPSPNELR